MNILFIISSNGKGAGGHFNSLNQVSLEMGKVHQVKIVLLGKGNSPVVEDNPFFEKKVTIGHSLSDFISLKNRLKNSLKNIFQGFVPDIIHCFDTDSLNCVLWSNLLPKTPIVLNKCGGRNPLKSNYQHANAIVTFSKENQQWFKNNGYYTANTIFLIPNRVRKLNLLPEEERKEKASKEKVTFVRISRLGGAYEMTLRQTYNLLDQLSRKIQVELFVIGKIQDNDRFNTLKVEGLNKNYTVHFITDDRAFKGSDFLYLADFVVGTGRSFMEATSLRIPTLTPAQNTQTPILVTKANLENFLSTNFSERNIASKGSEAKTQEEIYQIINDSAYKEKVHKDTLELFEEFFGTSKIGQKYNEVYEFAIKDPAKRRSLIIKNITYLIRYLILG
jgi:hypothetical protein